jgi:L-rhamnonate dehydratase
MLVTTGEHEATRWGFRMLLEMECCDIIQPDVGWCGGVTEIIKISNHGRQPSGVLMHPARLQRLQLPLRGDAP